jgi:predicted O-methyltransferase YrrM
MTHPRTLARTAIRDHNAIQKDCELALLVALVMDLEPQVVVEIGAFDGGTLWIWCQLAGLVVAVDRPPVGYKTETKVNTLGCPVVCGDSHDPQTKARLLEVLDGRPVDFLFIDGDHTFDGVKQDYEMYSPLVRPGGVVAFHDVRGHPSFQFVEVDRFWASLDGDKETFISWPHNWGGIGVLRIPDDPEAAVAERRERLEMYHRQQEASYR